MFISDMLKEYLEWLAVNNADVDFHHFTENIKGEMAKFKGVKYRSVTGHKFCITITKEY